jgi:integrase
VFGFSLDDVDRARNIVRVERQVRIVQNELTFAPPKRGKTREVPIGAALLAELDRYAEEFPPTPVTLPWVHRGGKPVTVNLLLVDLDGMPFRRGGFRLGVWLPALKRAGIVNPTRADGMHALRHLYASLLLDAGSRSRRCLATSGTRTPASLCASTPTCCRRATSGLGVRSPPSSGSFWTRTKSQAVTRRRDGLATA